MNGSGQEGERAERLARERALVRYMSALERGDFDGVAVVLRQAEADDVLERMIMEVNDVYRVEATAAELAGAQPAGARVPYRERVARGLDWLAAKGRRRGGDVTGKSSSSKRRAVAPAWIAGGVVVVVVMVCLGGWVLFSAMGRAGLSSYSTADTDEAGSYSGAAPVAERGMVEAPPPEPMEPGAGNRAAIQATAAPGLPAQVPGAQERLIIRTGTITLAVEDTLAAQQAIVSLVARMAGEGAYVVSSQQYGGGDGVSPYITMSIRVPAARFGEAMDTIAGLAVDVVDRNENADDVTEEYVDLEGRLGALETARDRLLQIMSEANRTEDLLQAEAQLTQREAEIEAIRGRMQYLSQSAALARITVQLQPYVLAQPVGTRWRPAETAREALEALLDGARGLIDFAIFFAIAILPWLLALAAGLYLLYRLIRWAVRRRQARAGAAGIETEA
ncbi:MAG TPA: DUF4349 domain-containing protein [Anaerolineae bacterium]|nr:DUF4349 domain-containing protein [Anaerolineae bacterium]